MVRGGEKMRNVDQKLKLLSEKPIGKTKSRLLMVVMGAMMLVGSASADLAGDLTNISTVVTSVVTWVTDIMAVFMEPPLVIFVGMTIAGIVISRVKHLMRG